MTVRFVAILAWFSIVAFATAQNPTPSKPAVPP